MARCKRLEAQVLTLAKSVSQLSIDIQCNHTMNDQIQTLRNEIEIMKSQLITMKQIYANNSNPPNGTSGKHQSINSNGTSINNPSQSLTTSKNSSNKSSKESSSTSSSSKKVEKIKRLFIDEPQPMKQFLKKLGYEVSRLTMICGVSLSIHSVLFYSYFVRSLVFDRNI